MIQSEGLMIPDSVKEAIEEYRKESDKVAASPRNVSKRSTEPKCEPARCIKHTSNNTPGWKFNEYEMKGVPLRLEIGPRDIENGVATAVRRDTHEKVQLNLENIVEEVKTLLAEIQANMLQQATDILNNSIVETNDYSEMVDAVNNKKVVLAYHCGNSDCEEEIRQNTTIKTRVIHTYDSNHNCIYCKKPSKYKVYFGKQY